MKVIQEKDTLAGQSLGTQECRKGDKMRFLTYCVATACDDGVLLHNVMTKELLLLENAEGGVICTPNLDDSPLLTQPDTELFQYLCRNWFIVPLTHDDKRLCLSLRAIAKQVAEVRNAGRLTDFTILPTTDCNARCFYCYQKGCQHTDMSEETALRVVEFIKRSCGGQKVLLNWFGGEPLYNTAPIDIITDGLEQAGIGFSSRMVSNAYLFDDEMVDKAVNRWKLKHIQVTLDGTEEVYNKRKAYIYHDGSAFVRVTDNIERLLKAGIKVSVRLNMDDRNFDDLMRLADYLANRYGKYKGFSAYPVFLYDEHARNPLGSSMEQICNYMLQLWQRLRGAHLLHEKRGLKKTIRVSSCMADSVFSVMIQANGNLGMCEHYYDSRPCGNIEEGITDMQEMAYWNQPGEDAARCDKCPLYPDCVHLAGCKDIYIRACQTVPAISAFYIEGLRESMLKYYNKQKSTTIV